MSETKPGGSRAGSKTNLNESTVPLLLVEEESRVVHKSPEGGAASTATGAGEKGGAAEKGAASEKGGSAETFELKEKGEEETPFRNGDTKDVRKPARGGKSYEHRPPLLDEMTVGLNLDDRDERRINEPINLAFGDVIAEPEATQGLEGPWKASYAAFTFVKSWVYSLLAAVIGVPLAIVWGLVFSLITFAFIWFVTPLLRVLDVGFSVVRRLVTTFATTFVEPFFLAIGAVMSQIKIRRHHTTGPATSSSASTATVGARGQQTDEEMAAGGDESRRKLLQHEDVV